MQSEVDVDVDTNVFIEDIFNEIVLIYEEAFALSYLAKEEIDFGLLKLADKTLSNSVSLILLCDDFLKALCPQKYEELMDHEIHCRIWEGIQEYYATQPAYCFIPDLKKDCAECISTIEKVLNIINMKLNEIEENKDIKIPNLKSLDQNLYSMLKVACRLKNIFL